MIKGGIDSDKGCCKTDSFNAIMGVPFMAPIMVTMKDLSVVKSNDIVEASYRLSLNEQRLILLCIAQIKKGQSISDKQRFVVNAHEFARTFKMALPNAYRDLQLVADKLYERSVTINNPDPDNPKLEQTKTRWISSIGYIPGDGELMITFAGPIIPYISLLEGRFTRYSIYSISDMHSIYGMRFYELMQKWKSESGIEKNSKELKLTDLKSLLELDNKYKSIKDFKKNVLEPAIKDINTYSDLKASYTQRKTGRCVTHIIFHFQSDEQLKMPLGESKPPPKRITKAYIDKHAEAGESYEQARRRLSARR